MVLGNCFIGRVTLALALLLLRAIPVLATTAEPPSVKLITAPLVTPAAAWTDYGTATTHTIGVAAPTTTPPEITELARALGAGRYTASPYALTVYEYVRNNITTDFRFGLSKGARGALIDQSGTAFDQAQLMVALLKANGITASYQVGTISLTAAEFQAWTGIANTSNGLISAAVACQFLADGAIPATVNGATSCTGLTGNLAAGTSIVMGHIWVLANGQTYDPSYKIHVIKNGIDVAAAMNCGTASAPTCGSTILADIPQQLKPGNGVPYIPGVPATQTIIESQLTTFATNLQHKVQSINIANIGTSNPSMQVEDLIGGRLVDISQPLPAATSNLISELPVSAYSAAQYSWTAKGDIPDQFRTTLTIQVDNISQLVFADETAGNRVRIWGTAVNGTTTTATRNLTLYSEYRPLATSSLPNATGAYVPITLTVQHPYAANGGTYADETLTFNTLLQSNTCDFPPYTTCSLSTSWGIGVVTILQGWGNVTESTVSHFSELARRDVTNTTPEDPTNPMHIWMQWRGNARDLSMSCVSVATPTGPVADTECFENHQGTIGATWLAQAVRGMTLAGQVNGVVVQHHHSLGTLLSGFSFDGAPNSGSTAVNVQSSVSGNATTALSSDRTAAFYGIAATMNRLEGSVLEQICDSSLGTDGLSMIVLANSLSVNLLQVTSGNYTTAVSELVNYPQWVLTDIQSYTNLGYTLILPQNGSSGTFSLNGTETVIPYSGYAAYGSQLDRIAYIAAGSDKGATGPGAADMESAVETSVKSLEYSTKGRKSFSVNLSDGDLALVAEPDLVTGEGEFPYSLSYQRVFSPANVAWARRLDNFPYKQGSPSYGDPETGVQRLSLGSSGWTHNFGIYAKIASDGMAGFGRDSALNAASAIAALYVQRNLNTGTPTMSSNLATIFTTHWLGEAFWDNEVTVTRPPRNNVFVKLPDQSFNPEPGSAEVLTQTGSRVPLLYGSGGGISYDSSNVAFTLTDKDGSVLNLVYRGLVSPYNNPIENHFMPSTWQFQNGVLLTFAYDQYNFLTGVSNNLGRSLTFLDANVSGGTGTLVTDDSGRSVQYSIASGYFPSTVSFTAPDNGVTTYNYVADPATAINRLYYRIAQWFTPTSSATTPFISVGYDSFYRVNGITDSLGNTTSYYVGGLYGRENQKRGEIMEPRGLLSTNPLITQYFDGNGLLLQETDPLNRTTTHVYDTGRRLTETIFPELNTDVFTYDIRSNQLTATHNPVPGATLATPPPTTTTYLEGPTVYPCIHPATCNKPVSSKDSNGHTTSYAYLTTGQLERVTGPAITSPASGSIPGQVTGQSQTDYCYAASFGSPATVSLLTAMVEKADASNNRVKAFAYNSANHWTLASSTRDPIQTYVPPATAGNACTMATKTTPVPLNYITNYTFDTVGNVSSVEDSNSNTTTYAFDLMRRLTTITPPTATLAMTRYCYDWDGELLSTNKWKATSAPIDPNASTETGSGQCTNPSGYPTGNWLVENRTYYPTGDLASVADGVPNITTYTYDPKGRQVVAQDPVGRQTATIYDVAGQVMARWRGGSTWISSPSSLPIASSAWSGSAYVGTGPIRYESYCQSTPQSDLANCYSLNGLPLYAVDADGHMTGYQYDGLDRLRVTYFPDPTAGTLCTQASSDGTLPNCTGQQTYELSAYDSVGNRTSLLTRRGDTIGYQFDAANRMVITSPAGQGAVYSGLDLLGEPYTLTKAAYPSLSLPAHTTSYSYDAAGRKTTETNDGLQVGYGYDPVGNRTGTTWPDGYYVSYAYDPLNRMQYVRENSTSTNELAYYVYDPLSRRTSLCLGAGSPSCASNTGWLNQVTYGYEPVDGQLNQLTHQLQSTLVSLNYTRNSAYQIQTLQVGDSFYLPSSMAASSVTYTPNSLNEYQAVGGNAAKSDPNGNLLTWFPPGGTGMETNTYDSENRLTQAVYGATTDNFDYDALGRRVSKTFNGQTTLYLHDGDEEIAEYSGSSLSGGTLQRRYVTGPRVDDRIVHVESGSTTPPVSAHTYYHVNHQGSVIAVSDYAGNITGGAANGQRLSYDEYGNLSPGSNPVGEPFRYTGQRFDAEIGLYYYRARYYSPQLGRFLQTDPIGYKDDIDLYTYTGNDPLNKNDPTGQGAEVLAIPAGVILATCYLTNACQTLAHGLQQFHDNIVRNESAPKDPPVDKPADTAPSGRTANDPLPRDKDGTPIPDEEAAGTDHSQLGTEDSSSKPGQTYPSAREFNSNDEPQREFNFTDHDRKDHPNPHQHVNKPNPSGGTPQRGKKEPLPPGSGKGPQRSKWWWPF